MAERALTDTAWYKAAIADPKAFLPTYYAFLSRTRIREGVNIMTSQKSAVLISRAAAFLEAAQAAHMKWNGTTWTRPRHLMGLLCQEERRISFARALLGWLAPITARSLPPEAADEPEDDIKDEALAQLRVHIASGAMRQEIDLWGLDKAEVVAELKLLATAPRGLTDKDPVLGPDRTPHLYKAFIPMLFVVRVRVRVRVWVGVRVRVVRVSASDGMLVSHAPCDLSHVLRLTP